jgi:hypothetical protein
MCLFKGSLLQQHGEEGTEEEELEEEEEAGGKEVGLVCLGVQRSVRGLQQVVRTHV